MDTNDKIVGIVFEIDRDLYNVNVEKGVSPSVASRLSAKSIMLFHQDKNNNEYIDLSNYSESTKESVIKENFDKAINAGLSREEISSYYSGDPRVIDALDRAQNHKEYMPFMVRETIVKNATEDEKKKANKNKIKLTAAILGTAAVTALSAWGISKIKANDKEEITIETQSEIQDWAQYLATIPVTNEQRQLFVNDCADWLTAINVQEDWMKVVLTEEEMKELNYTDPECLFGFTAEEAYSLALRFNSYTNDQYVTLTGGERMDTVAIMNDGKSASNGALASIQAYYINSDKCDLHIDKLLTFTEVGQNKINELETLFNEYKTLDKEENKEKEAKEKMAEIKSVLLECAYDTTFDANAKSYILRTFLPAANTISQMHQYRDTIEIDVYDTKKDTNVTKEIKTDLFDEITMRALSLGFNSTDNVDGFDSEQFLENHDIDASRYNLLYNDVASSIADQSCSGQMTKLDEANKYIDSLKEHDTTAEFAYAGGQGMDLTNVNYDTLNNVQTDYDTLTADTLNPTDIMGFLDDYLKENNIYPKNIEYFSTKMIELKMIAYKDTHGITQGKPGDIIKTETRKQVPVTEADLKAPNAIVRNHAGEIVTAEEAMEEAEEIHEDKTGIFDEDDPGEKEENQKKAEESQGYKDRTALLQNVYNATYNYFYGQDVLATTSGYDAGWASSSDPEIVNRHETAKSQALSRKEQEEAARIENEKQQNQQPIIDDEFKDAETSKEPQAPVESVDNTTKLPEVSEPEVIPSQPEIKPSQPESDNNVKEPEVNYFPGFEDAEIEGDIVIGDVTPTTEEVNQTSQDGISTEAPAGFAPVVEESTVVENNNSSNFITMDEIDSLIENMSDEQWAQFEETGELVKTR